MAKTANETKEMKQAKSEKSEMAQTTQAVENVMREIATTKTDLQNKMVNGLKLAKSLDNLNNGTWYTKDVMEIISFKMALEKIEILTLPMELIYKMLDCNYIIGVTDYTITTNKKDKTFNFSVEVKSKIYGDYKARLEGYGLIFPAETNEEKQRANEEKQDAINEANSILQSFGLKGIELN